jgi:hypothetical protein
LRAAAQDLTDLVSHLAEDDDALVAAATNADQFLDYVKKHGGDKKRRLMSERAALAFDRILGVASAEFARLAPSSSRFLPSALAEILGQLPSIAADARRAADGVDELLGRGDRNVVAAAHAASKTGIMLGRPVPDWTPTQLGVHATIVVDGVTGLTPYMLREHDTKLREALAQLRQPGARPRLVTVVGTSCTGKTRTLYEAVDQVLADWTLVKPADIDELTRMVYAGVPKHTVVWLDELQDFLTIQAVDAARAIHQLIDNIQSPPIAFAATIWPTNLTDLEQRPDPAGAKAGVGEIRNLLRKTASNRHHVPDTFHKDELDAVGRNDPRMTQAINHAVDGQVTQLLAGGTHLVRRVYPDQPHTGDIFSPAARAVVLAAADLRRVGHPNPLPRWALEGAAPGYLNPAERRRLDPATWIQDALDETAQDATSHRSQQLDIYQRGVPALTRLWHDGEVTDSNAEVECYELHDYLLQHHLTACRYTPTATSLWNTVTASNNLPKLAPQIAAVLAVNAKLRGLYSETVILNALTAASSEWSGVNTWSLGFIRDDAERMRLIDERASADAYTDFLAERRDEECRRSPDRDSASLVAEWLARPGNEERLRTLALIGDRQAKSVLVDLLGKRGDLEGLRATADSGDAHAKYRLAILLSERGDVKGLSARADDNDPYAQLVLADLLAERGDEARLRAMAEEGDYDGQKKLADLLGKRGAVKELRDLVHAAVEGAADVLINLYWIDRSSSTRLQLDVNAEPRPFLQPGAQ